MTPTHPTTTTDNSDADDSTDDTSDATHRVDLDNYHDALCAAYAAGERDAADGGVPPTAVAERVNVSVDTAHGWLRTLVDQGRAARRIGLNPDTYAKRHSFVPADADGGDDA